MDEIVRVVDALQLSAKYSVVRLARFSALSGAHSPSLPLHPAYRCQDQHEYSLVTTSLRYAHASLRQGESSI